MWRSCAPLQHSPRCPNTRAGISGSIEEGDASPLDAAARELNEETNVCDLFRRHARDSGGDGDDAARRYLRSLIKQGLHVDVPAKSSKGAFGGRVIRVYPFALPLPADENSDLWSELEMRGTEHDEMRFVRVEDFLSAEDPCVPSLKEAFHHATSGAYLEVRYRFRWCDQNSVGRATVKH